MLVGSLNCLGDAHNPFEFISDDPTFRAGYDRLHQAAEELSWLDFEASCGSGVLTAPGADGKAGDALARLKTHCDEGRSLWAFFDEPTLEQDNKMHDLRFNLLTFAMMPYGEDRRPTWELQESWREEMIALLARADSSYAQDVNLWLWDVTCNVVAASAPSEYEGICKSSYLNADNFLSLGLQFADAALRAAADRPLVLGVQEWPAAGTQKGNSYLEAFSSRGMCVHAPGGVGGVAFLSSKELGTPELLDISASRDIMQQVIDRAIAEGAELDKKAIQGFLQTTALKVMAARFPEAQGKAAEFAFLSIHAKEPKTDAAAKVLARFTTELGAAVTGISNADARLPIVAMLDTNLAKVALCETFAAVLRERQLASSPPPSVMTTSKQRSILHGQRYDTTKCMKVVKAPKDKLVAPMGSLSDHACFPNLEGMASGLPSPSWASDHSLTTAVLAV